MFQKGNTINLGKHLSEEHKRKISLAKKGIYRHTDETKLKIGKGNLGKIISEEQREKLRLAMLGRHPSEETIQKMILSRIGSKRSDETKLKMSLAASGPKSRFWKGGRKKDTGGYILIYNPEHPFAEKKGYVREHRLVMEEKLGRYLLPQEVVHHINGILDDNRIENLELFKNQNAHVTFHNYNKDIYATA